MSEPANLVLTGFMGTGKTTVGQRISRRLGLPFVDTDSLIRARTGMSIPEIFARLGESEFRRLEREVCADLASRHGQVIATGGGMLLDSANLHAMTEGGAVICLWASPEDLRVRLSLDHSRPLASNWEALLEARRQIYAAMPYHIQTTNKTPDTVAEEAIALWQKHSR